MRPTSDSDQKPKTDRGKFLVPTTPAGELSSTAAAGIASDVAAQAAIIEAKTEGYQERAHASNTRRAYKADWEHFEAWCKLYGAQALPADPRLVARYLSAYAGVLSVATLGRRLSGIQFVHVAAELDFDRRERTLRDTWRGIRRTHGVASRGKTPTVTEELRALVSTLDLAKAIGIRDRALLLLGFAGCYRRSEIVSIDHEHVAEHRGRACDLTPVVQDRPGGPGLGERNPVRSASGDLSGAGAQGLDRGGGYK